MCRNTRSSEAHRNSLTIAFQAEEAEAEAEVRIPLTRGIADLICNGQSHVMISNSLGVVPNISIYHPQAVAHFPLYRPVTSFPGYGESSQIVIDCLRRVPALRCCNATASHLRAWKQGWRARHGPVVWGVGILLNEVRGLVHEHAVYVALVARTHALLAAVQTLACIRWI
jgi:hypothetical protein